MFSYTRDTDQQSWHLSPCCDFVAWKLWPNQNRSFCSLLISSDCSVRCRTGCAEPSKYVRVYNLNDLAMFSFCCALMKSEQSCECAPQIAVVPFGNSLETYLNQCFFHHTEFIDKIDQIWWRNAHHEMNSSQSCARKNWDENIHILCFSALLYNPVRETARSCCGHCFRGNHHPHHPIRSE